MIKAFNFYLSNLEKKTWILNLSKYGKKFLPIYFNATF